jgi:LytS/YehU family sensor histidine kinase
VVSTLVICGIWIILGSGWVRVIAQLPGWGELPVRFQRIVPFFFGIGALLYGLAIALHYLFLFFENSKAAEHRALTSQIMARESELKALKAQIHPHFLFNSLNSISALTSSDPRASREMCLLLADFLRKSLRYAGEQTVPLAEELDLAEKYLAIEKVRFGERLRYECQAEEGGMDLPILPLLLQPLVENAVNHGISQLLEGGLIRLEVRITDGKLRIAMENPCDPERKSPARSGFGLSLVSRRLEEYYGEESHLIAENRAGRFRVEISYPIQVPAR